MLLKELCGCHLQERYIHNCGEMAMNISTDQPSTEASIPSKVAGPDTIPNERHSLNTLSSHSSIMDLNAAPNGLSAKKREQRRSESQVWRPREALSSQRPSWASVGHHAIVDWRSPSRFDGESTIRVVRDPEEESDYDVENDSMWSSLESDTMPLLPKTSLELDEQNRKLEEYGLTPRAPASQPALPIRDPPGPPSWTERQDSMAGSDIDIQGGKEEGGAKKSRFIEHVAENAEVFKQLGIP